MHPGLIETAMFTKSGGKADEVPAGSGLSIYWGVRICIDLNREEEKGRGIPD